MKHGERSCLECLSRGLNFQRETAGIFLIDYGHLQTRIR
jgi:hypothetical protein